MTRYSKYFVVFAALLFLTPQIVRAVDGDPPPTPVMRSVDPASGKVGDVLTVSGENLGKANIAEVYLTNGNQDLKVEVIEQGETAIKFKVPAKATAGTKYNLMVLTARKVPNLIEQPVSVRVE